eukprot:gene18887-25445_t
MLQQTQQSRTLSSSAQESVNVDLESVDQTGRRETSQPALAGMSRHVCGVILRGLLPLSPQQLKAHSLLAQALPAMASLLIQPTHSSLWCSALQGLTPDKEEEETNNDDLCFRDVASVLSQLLDQGEGPQPVPEATTTSEAEANHSLSNGTPLGSDGGGGGGHLAVVDVANTPHTAAQHSSSNGPLSGSGNGGGGGGELHVEKETDTPHTAADHSPSRESPLPPIHPGIPSRESPLPPIHPGIPSRESHLPPIHPGIHAFCLHLACQAVSGLASRSRQSRQQFECSAESSRRTQDLYIEASLNRSLQHISAHTQYLLHMYDATYTGSRNATVSVHLHEGLLVPTGGNHTGGESKHHLACGLSESKQHLACGLPESKWAMAWVLLHSLAECARDVMSSGYGCEMLQAPILSMLRVVCNPPLSASHTSQGVVPSLGPPSVTGSHHFHDSHRSTGGEAVTLETSSRDVGDASDTLLHAPTSGPSAQEPARVPAWCVRTSMGLTLGGVVVVLKRALRPLLETVQDGENVGGDSGLQGMLCLASAQMLEDFATAAGLEFEEHELEF